MGYTSVGRLNKSFGIKGYIKVIPDPNFISDLERSTVWFVQKGKEVVPFFVESIEHEPHFLVKFEDINDPESAKHITGSTLVLRSKDITVTKPTGENDLAKLVNFRVVNGNDWIGNIVSVEEFPQQLMAIIAKEKIELMMPLTPEFIIDIDLEKSTIYVELPEGFVESQL